MQAQLNHPAAAALDATSNSSSSASSTGSGTEITANDFLTLLVAEMKNQDPTATTDPNAYIDQLVQVNSLEQLIQINQEVGSLGTGSSTGTSSTSNTGSGSSPQLLAGHLASAAHVLANALAPHSSSQAASETRSTVTQNGQNV
ncbi:MAG: flagellar hook capping FlgD N-terminal domain-containing protein [Bacillota bacterium]|nr:flagellar hook capping FlgD N-terminal domain-containing protein [Bacillota bacterium]